MKPELCEFEEAVTAAALSGSWNDELRKHLAGCRECADLCLVFEHMAGSTSLMDSGTTLPTAGLIWWRAKLTERQEQAKRAVAAIEIMQKLAIAIAVIAVVAFAWVWKQVDWNIVLMGLGLLVSTGVVLYSWVRGRI